MLVSNPGTKCDKISAANMPCIRRGFRASRIFDMLMHTSSGLRLGTGETAKANDLVNKSNGGEDETSDAKIAL
jgi:hypothetical protein